MADKQEENDINLPRKSFLFPIISSNSSEISHIPQTGGLFPSVTANRNEEKETPEWLSNASYNTRALYEHLPNFQELDDCESMSSRSSNEEELLKKVELKEAEKHDRKHRKKDKSKKQRTHVHKHKKHKKQKISDEEKLTKLPSTIWIEESGLEFEKAFRIHRKPDHENRAFGGLYRLDIALHYQNPKLKCLGLTKDQVIDSEQKKGKERKGKRKSAQRYWENESLPSSDKLLICNQTAREKGFGFSKNFSYVPLELPGTVQDENNESSAPEKNRPISELLSKTKDLNQKVRENPTNVQAWLALADLQSQQVDARNLTTESLNRTAVEKQKKSSKLSMEKKAVVLEQAVEKNPSCVELIVAYMNVCTEMMSSEAILEKWRKLLFTHPQKTVLWKHYLMFCQSNFSAFSFSSTLAVYTKCFTTLSAIQSGRFTSHSAEVDMESGMVEIFLQFCQFLRQSGQTEKAVAAFQALIEFNCFCPQTAQEDRSLTSFFEKFWDSDVPRFGEENARGWDIWMEDEPEKPHDIPVSEIFPCCTTSEGLTQEKILSRHSEKTATWLDVEALRESEQWRPKKTSDEEDEDPDRIVLFQDISFVLFEISDENLKFQLVCYFLSFLGNPIDLDYCHYLPSTVALERLLHVLLEDEKQMKYGKGFACGWTQQAPDVSLQMFVRNIFNQSLVRFSEDLQAVLALFWLSFETNILVAESNHKQRKQRYKAARKLAKSLLKVEQHRNNLRLWFAFIEIEWINGNLDETRRVMSSLLEQSQNFTSTDEISIMRSYHFVRSCCELEMNLRNDDERNEKHDCFDDLRCRILPAISALVCKVPSSDHAMLTPAQILKTHKALQERSSQILTDFLGWNLELASREQKQFMVDFMICYALFQYWSLGLDAAKSVLDSFLSAVSAQAPRDAKFSGSKEHEDVVVFYCRLLLFHSRHNVCPVKPLRDLLWSSLSTFPESAFLLYSLVRLELRSCVSTSIRRYFDSVLGQSRTPLPWLFAIFYEKQRQKTFQSVIRNPFELPGSQKDLKNSHLSAVTILPQTGVLHRLRSLYERAIHHPSARHCVAIWRSYMKFEAENGDLRQAKAIFYQSLQCCAWSKLMYMDAMKVFPELFQDVYDMIEEKELRIRTPLEELELLLEN